MAESDKTVNIKVILYISFQKKTKFINWHFVQCHNSFTCPKKVRFFTHLSKAPIEAQEHSFATETDILI